MSQLSKVLKSDASMVDVVKNIKQHFSFNETPGKASGDQSSARDQKQSMLPHMNAVGSQRSADTSGELAPAFGLQDAINLLSLDEHHRKSRKRSKRRRSKGIINMLGKPTSEKSATFDGRIKSFDKRCSIRDMVADENRLSELNIIKQSTWPGKAQTSHSERQHGSLMNDWSLWPDTSQFAPPPPPPPCDPFGTDSFQVAWNTFASSEPSSTRTPSCSVSASASGSMSGDSSNGVTLSSVGCERRRNACNNGGGMGGMFGTFNQYVEHSNSSSSLSDATVAAKRVSSSSEGLKFDGGVDLSSSFSSAFNDPHASATAGNHSVPLEVRIAKTSTWPLKQQTSAAAAAASSSNWAVFSPIPAFGRDTDSRSSFAPSPAQQAHALISNSSPLWPFEGPTQSTVGKMQLPHNEQFSLFEANNNDSLMNKNY